MVSHMGWHARSGDPGRGTQHCPCRLSVLCAASAEILSTASCAHKHAARAAALSNPPQLARARMWPIHHQARERTSARSRAPSRTNNNVTRLQTSASASPTRGWYDISLSPGTTRRHTAGRTRSPALGTQQTQDAHARPPRRHSHPQTPDMATRPPWPAAHDPISLALISHIPPRVLCVLSLLLQLVRRAPPWGAPTRHDAGEAWAPRPSARASLYCATSAEPVDWGERGCLPVSLRRAIRDAIDWSHEPGPAEEEVSYLLTKLSSSTPKGAVL